MAGLEYVIVARVRADSHTPSARRPRPGQHRLPVAAAGRTKRRETPKHVHRRRRRLAAVTVPPPRGPTISVVVPALNEAANLPHVFARLPSWIDEVILVDGGSSDDTVAVARAVCPGVRVVAQDARPPAPGQPRRCPRSAQYSSHLFNITLRDQL